MSEYFILTKKPDGDITDDSCNQLWSTAHQHIYILPKSLMKYYVYGGLYEKGLIDWCRQFCDKSKVMLDIGAHTGTYTISLAKHCKHVYAFEPQKMTYYALCGSIALSNIRNVTCINSGLGSEDQNGKQTLHIVSVDGGCSSLIPPSNAIDAETVDIKTLDSYNLDEIGFIKIDVEGNELCALQGAEETLKRSNYPKILFEMNTRDEQLLEYLKSLQYNVIPIHNVSNMFLAENQSALKLAPR